MRFDDILIRVLLVAAMIGIVDRGSVVRRAEAAGRRFERAVESVVRVDIRALSARRCRVTTDRA